MFCSIVMQQTKPAMIQLRFIAFLLLSLYLTAATPVDFYQDQLRAPRVANAIKVHRRTLTDDLNKFGIGPNDVQLLIVAYKAEQELEVYVRRTSEKRYRRFATFPICASSGMLGPKKRKGDGQVPEGVYHLDRFNPYSNFHLSLGLNYPNAEDRQRAGRLDPGGDIFIHGSCVTIGCMPMTDPVIERIYLLAIWSRRNGQPKIPVYSFPFRMNDANLTRYSRLFPEHAVFWRSLAEKSRDLEQNLLL